MCGFSIILMKTKLLFLSLVIISFCLFANDLLSKDKYAHGKVFLMNHDTLNVYVKVESLYNMQNGIQYVDSIGIEHLLNPAKAKGFNLVYSDGTMVFESRNDLTKVLFQLKNPGYYFVQRILDGKLSLYYFVEKKLVMEGIDQVLIEKARYFVRINEEWYTITKEYFKNDCRKIFSILKREGFVNEIKAMINDIDSDKYKYEDTPTIIDRCNHLILSGNKLV